MANGETRRVTGIGGKAHLRAILNPGMEATTMKGFASRVESEYHLWRGLRRLRGELRTGVVSRQALAEIWLGWGNVGFSCSVDCLGELAALALSDNRGTILEFGGGVSTLMLSVISEFTGERVVTIEHDEGWCQDLRKTLARRTAGQFDVRHAPLENRGERVWYRLDQLPPLVDVALVFVDGPPGSTSGGRRGVLESVAPHLPGTAAVVIDDTNRDADRRIAEEWAAMRGLRRKVYNASRDRAFDVLLSEAP